MRLLNVVSRQFRNKFKFSSFYPYHDIKIRFHHTVTACNEMRNEKGIVLGLYEHENGISAPKATIDFIERTNNKLSSLIGATKMSGKSGTSMVFNNLDSEYSSIVVVGLGKRDIAFNKLENIEEGMENVRAAAAIGTNILTNEGCSIIHIDSMDFPECVAEGSGLANWQYQENKLPETRQPLPKLHLYGSSEQDEWIRGAFKAHAQNLTRDLCEMPANQLTPTTFAQAAVDALCPCGVNVEVRTMDWIESQNMSAFLSVARSSCEPAAFLEINYCGGEIGESPILLVGSGQTFNSGGLCLKSSEDLAETRSAMAGAAVVVSTMRAIAALQLPINVSAVIPLCENMPSGRALKPGDIIKCLNGKSIAVHDTENVSVLLMADGLLYGQRIHRPKLIVNVATVSNGAQSAFGNAASAVFTNSNFFWTEIEKAGSITGDRVCRLPFWKYFIEKVTDYSAVDVSNTGQEKASSCLGAAILNEFILCPYWLSIDIRGVGMLTTTSDLPYFKSFHMTGRPTRTLIQFLYQLACIVGRDSKWTDILDNQKIK